jgi:oligopeptide transport system ATP-binding protein
VAVMHEGHIVEMGTVEDIYENSMHPYTRSLLSAIPHPDPDAEHNRKRFMYIKGGVDYNIGTIRQLTFTHSILATDEEFSLWKQNDYTLFLK